MSNHEFLRVAVEDGIATITLNRPPLNVLNIPMMRELNTVLGSELDHDALGAIVFRAEGKAFSAGVDVADHTGAKVAEMIRLFHGIFRQLAATDALTIAAVGRAALGGGCELACFCDIVLASDRAKFGQPEIQVGVLPPVAACLLPAQIGIKKAIELNALGATIDAAEAHRIGLVNQVFPADTFDRDVDAYLAPLKKLSRPVVRLAKRTTALQVREAMLAQLDRVEAIYLEELMQLEDAHEGIAAFLEKRDPIWKHA
ncbi:MAG: enoyl-CoA hydratase/isomerase family protein [Planctomycetes bacterium]|nr:enoyl-CoA hydratase/isomerase family protein [Planctomycetota bacterium]